VLQVTLNVAGSTPVALPVGPSPLQAGTPTSTVYVGGIVSKKSIG